MFQIGDNRSFCFKIDRSVNIFNARRQIITGDRAPYGQDAYAVFSKADERSLENIFDEYKAVRLSTLALFKYLPEESLDRLGHGTGTFNNATPRALVYHIAGHEQHHIHFIKNHYI